MADGTTKTTQPINVTSSQSLVDNASIRILAQSMIGGSTDVVRLQYNKDASMETAMLNILHKGADGKVTNIAFDVIAADNTSDPHKGDFISRTVREGNSEIKDYPSMQEAMKNIRDAIKDGKFDPQEVHDVVQMAISGSSVDPNKGKSGGR